MKINFYSLFIYTISLLFCDSIKIVIHIINNLHFHSYISIKVNIINPSRLSMAVHWLKEHFLLEIRPFLAYLAYLACRALGAFLETQAFQPSCRVGSAHRLQRSCSAVP